MEDSKSNIVVDNNSMCISMLSMMTQQFRDMTESFQNSVREQRAQDQIEKEKDREERRIEREMDRAERQRDREHALEMAKLQQINFPPSFFPYLPPIPQLPMLPSPMANPIVEPPVDVGNFGSSPLHLKDSDEPSPLPPTIPAFFSKDEGVTPVLHAVKSTRAAPKMKDGYAKRSGKIAKVEPKKIETPPVKRTGTSTRGQTASLTPASLKKPKSDNAFWSIASDKVLFEKKRKRGSGKIVNVCPNCYEEFESDNSILKHLVRNHKDASAALELQTRKDNKKDEKKSV